MKIKKYEGSTEYEAIQKVKDDLGKEALILNVKKVQPKGLFRFFKKMKVEVMAAYDENIARKEVETEGKNNSNASAEKFIKQLQEKEKENRIEEQQKTIQSLESKLDNLEGLLTKVVQRVSVSEQVPYNGHSRKYKSTVLQLFYDTLIHNETAPEVADVLLKDLDESEIYENDMQQLVKVVYQRIMELVGTPRPIVVEENSQKPKVVVFIGPTGVGKTTTIAKITAHFILNEHKNVGLITADTYRIAAVEQLKTYAEILGVAVEVIYSPMELDETLEKMEDKDIVFIDTAGRSHKNEQQMEEILSLLQQVPESEIYLVMSMTTKYKDMLNIIKAYTNIPEYNIIFTKADETTSFGTVLNISYMTKKPLSYMTIGQNVPDDIEIIKSEKIAKQLLGSTDE